MKRLWRFVRSIVPVYREFIKHPEYRGSKFTWLFPLQHAWTVSLL